MSGEHHLASESLSAADIAQLGQNWSIANEWLDCLIALNDQHREKGCKDWYCGTDGLVSELARLELHEVQMVLRAAIERMGKGVSAQ